MEKERLKECYFIPKGKKRSVSKESVNKFYNKNVQWKESVEKFKRTQNVNKNNEIKNS